MKSPKIVSIVLFLLSVFSVFSQENTTSIKQTPEQEAIKQTEKLQQELNLNSEQTKKIYEINLKYAHARQISNKRSEAVERMKNKNGEIQQVLTQEQNDKLQTKRYERTTVESATVIQNRPTNPLFNPNQEQRINPTIQNQPAEHPTRRFFRSTTPTIQSEISTPQTVHRSISTDQQKQTGRGNPSTIQPSIPTSSSTPQRTDNKFNTRNK